MIYSAYPYELRPVSESDAEEFCAMIRRNKNRIEYYFPVTAGSNNTKSETKLFLRENCKRARRKESFFFVVEVKETSALAACLIIKNVDWTVPKAELAFFTDVHHERKGLATKMLSALASHAFESLKLKKVYLRIDPDNKGSLRVAEKCGFELEGILKKDFRASDGTLIDVCQYGLLNPGDHIFVKK